MKIREETMKREMLRWLSILFFASGGWAMGAEPASPYCTLLAVPSEVHLGEPVTLAILTGNAESASLEGRPIAVPSDQLRITPISVGTFTATATVNGADGNATCSTVYQVLPALISSAATCWVTVTPSEVTVGDLLTVHLSTKGDVDYASIAGTSVGFPQGSKIIAATEVGDHSVFGFVRSKGGGSSNCRAYYTVHPGAHPPPIPSLALVNAYCGDNALSSEIRSVCIADVNHFSGAQSALNQAIGITYRDNSQEWLPVVERRVRRSADPNRHESLLLYANQTLSAPAHAVLDSREAELVLARDKDGNYVPSSITGTSSRGEPFQVIALRPPVDR